MIQESVQMLVEEEQEARGLDGGAAEIVIVLMPLSYEGDVDSDGSRAHYETKIENVLHDSEMLTLVSKDAMRAGMEGVRIAVSYRMFDRDARERFHGVLIEEAEAPESFLFPRLTTGPTVQRGADRRARHHDHAHARTFPNGRRGLEGVDRDDSSSVIEMVVG